MITSVFAGSNLVHQSKKLIERIGSLLNRTGNNKEKLADRGTMRKDNVNLAVVLVVQGTVK